MSEPYRIFCHGLGNKEGEQMLVSLCIKRQLAMDGTKPRHAVCAACSEGKETMEDFPEVVEEVKRGIADSAGDKPTWTNRRQPKKRATVPHNVGQIEQTDQIEQIEQNEMKEEVMAKGMKACPSCGTEQGVVARTCKKCGNAFPGKEAGTVLKAGHRTCTVEGCKKYGVKDGMCTRHFNESKGIVKQKAYAAHKSKENGGQKSAAVPKETGIVAKLIEMRDQLKRELAAVEAVMDLMEQRAP